MKQDTIYREIALGIGADITAGPWIAGGAARRMYQCEQNGDDTIFMSGNTKYASGDIDIFLPSENYDAARLRVIDYFNKQPGFGQFSGSPNCTGVLEISGISVKVQIIKDGYESLTTLFRSFDYTVSQFAASGQFLAFYDTSTDDLITKTLALAEPVQPRRFTTPVRLSKYCSYGYTPAPGVFEWAVGLGENEVNDDMTVSDGGTNGY